MRGEGETAGVIVGTQDSGFRIQAEGAKAGIVAAVTILALARIAALITVVIPITIVALSPLGERVARDGVFTSRRGTGEGCEPESITRRFFLPVNQP
jgi:hypothetical protein